MIKSIRVVGPSLRNRTHKRTPFTARQNLFSSPKITREASLSKIYRKSENAQNNLDHEIEKQQNVTVRRNHVDQFTDRNFILIDFEAISSEVCEFPAIWTRNGEIKAIFHAYCRPSKAIRPDRYNGFYKDFLGHNLNFYLKQNSFKNVEWQFCKWCKHHKLMVETQKGSFDIASDTAIVTQGTEDFNFLNTSLMNNKVSMDRRPCYKYFYDLDALWIHAIGTNPPGSPRMHNMAKDQGWDVVPNAHSGIHDTLQLYYVFDGLRKSLENKENILRRALRKNRALIK